MSKICFFHFYFYKDNPEHVIVHRKNAKEVMTGIHRYSVYTDHPFFYKKNIEGNFEVAEVKSGPYEDWSEVILNIADSSMFVDENSMNKFISMVEDIQNRTYSNKPKVSISEFLWENFKRCTCDEEYERLDKIQVLLDFGITAYCNEKYLRIYH